MTKPKKTHTHYTIHTTHYTYTLNTLNTQHTHIHIYTHEHTHTHTHTHTHIHTLSPSLPLSLSISLSLSSDGTSESLSLYARAQRRTYPLRGDISIFYDFLIKWFRTSEPPSLGHRLIQVPKVFFLVSLWLIVVLDFILFTSWSLKLMFIFQQIIE